MPQTARTADGESLHPRYLSLPDAWAIMHTTAKKHPKLTMFLHYFNVNFTVVYCECRRLTTYVAVRHSPNPVTDSVHV